MGRTDVVVDELDLGQREGVVDAHEDGGLHHNVYQVHDLVPEKERSRPQPCMHHSKLQPAHHSGGG